MIWSVVAMGLSLQGLLGHSRLSNFLVGDTGFSYPLCSRGVTFMRYFLRSAGMVLACLFLVCLDLAAPGLAQATTLHRGNGAEPGTLDPHKSIASYEMSIISDLFLGLYTEDVAGQRIYGAAESEIISDDGLTYTFRMRQGHTWSDGVPVTASDFVLGMRRILNPATAGQYASLLYMIKNAELVNTGQLDPQELGIRALNPSTLEISLNNPTPYFLELLAHPASFAIPSHIYEDHGDDWIRPENVVSNGAYLLTEWSSHEFVHLIKNPTFFEADNVAIEEVFYYPTDDASAALIRFRAGEIDLNACSTCYPATRSAWLDENLPGVRRPEAVLSTAYITINVSKPPFDDPRVRKALSLALRRDIITEKVNRAGQIVAWSFVPPGIANYDHVPTVLAASRSAGDNIEQAKALLAEAGYSPSNPLSFNFRYRSAGDTKKQAVATVAMWKNVDINATLFASEPSVHYAALRAGDFEVADDGWTADYSDAQNFLFLLETSSKEMNNARYSNAEFDALMDEAASTLDLIKRSEILGRAEAIMLHDQPIIPLYHNVGLNLVGLHVEGWVENSYAVHQTRYISLKSRE